jgi:hypothetical protein
MQMTKHKTQSVFERHDIVSKSDLDEAGKKLGEYLNLKPIAKDTDKIMKFIEVSKTA